MAFFLDEFTKLIESAEKEGLDYAVCGAVALAIQGFPRATMDIDLLIQEQSLEKALKIAADRGYDVRGLDISFKDPILEIRTVSKIIGDAILRLEATDPTSLQRPKRTNRNAVANALFNSERAV